LIRRVSDRLGFDGSQTLLDLGTGPGQLALAFAPFVGAVTAIDPEPEMLRIAGEQARQAGARITLLEGSSYTLDERLGRFDLVSIGRAFHWTDRRATLQTLDRLVQSGGAVALFSTRHLDLPDNAWVEDFDALRDIHGERDSHRQLMRSAAWLSHEAILLESNDGSRRSNKS
jgi:ubiquinone/menaquinone biosynthesis C-methylase UbiE